MKKLVTLQTMLVMLPLWSFGWNPIEDVRQNLTWTFGKTAQAGSGYDFAANKWRSSALAEILEYRMFSFSYGATFFSDKSPQAADTLKFGLLSSFFFNLFANKPTPEMFWMTNLNIGPSYSLPVFSGGTGHKGIFLLDINYRFSGVK